MPLPQTKHFLEQEYHQPGTQFKQPRHSPPASVPERVCRVQVSPLIGFMSKDKSKKECLVLHHYQIQLNFRKALTDALHS